MQVFACPACSGRVYFDNTACACGQQVTFDPEGQRMRPGGEFCANRAVIGCNWVAETKGYCRSCTMTETVPDRSEGDNVALWARTAAAKRWMLANLGRWGWFTRADTGRRPVFDLLSEQTARGNADIVMGHDDGTIVINVSEASETTRQTRRESLGELYRTMLGHMRHEIAHFLHLRLEQEPGFLDGFRALMGDERADYAGALERHYAAPRPPDRDFITGYATAHPHEDWAETTAHLLHLVDLLDSALAAGLTWPGGPPGGYDAYAEADAERVLRHAVDAALAVNHVNRAMELPDLYPFVLGDGVRAKLAFVHGHMRLNAS